MPMLQCAHCGYILTGLLAKNCSDCGHLYLQCPECGRTQEANTIGTPLVRTMQRVVARLPRFVQGFDIAALIIAGTMMAIFGFGWVTTRNLSDWGLWGLIAPWCGVVTAGLQVAVFRFRGRWFVVLSSAAFVFGAILAGMLPAPLVTVTAAGTLFSSPPQLLRLLMAILLGVGLGALLARQIAWVAMLLLLKREDRQWVVSKYLAALREKLAWKKTPAAPLVTAYCGHCGAAMPPVQAGHCPKCQLLKVDCPSCNGSTAIPNALPAADAGAELLKACWLFCLGALRFAMLCWYFMYALIFYSRTSYWGMAYGVVTGTMRYASMGYMFTPILVMAVVTMLVAFTGRGILAALAGLLVLPLVAWAAWWLSLTNEDLRYVSTSSVTVGVSLLAVVLAALVTRAATRVIIMVLPGRRMPEVEEALPQPASAVSSGSSEPREA